MKEKKRIVFIDSDINIEYVNKLANENQIIGGVWTIINNRVTPSKTFLVDTLSHGTLCSKVFLKHTTCACELFYLNIWKDDELNANINALLVALSWCLENDIKLINLSLGTTRIVDIPELFDIVTKLVKKNIIIIAASSNEHRLTFPASFDHVIGVKALESKPENLGFIYQEESIDLTEISCYVTDEIMEYKNQQYFLCVANSFAAPIISAKICNFLDEGYDSIKQIKMKLKEDSLHSYHNQDDEIYKNYFVQEITTPIIAIISDCHSENFDIALLVQKLLMNFSNLGYYGVCLSEDDLTDLSKKTINLIDFKNYTPVEKLHFYTHYCDIDFVIVKGSKAFLLEDLKTVETDIILYNSNLNHLEVVKETSAITFSESTDLDLLFKQVYSHLSS